MENYEIVIDSTCDLDLELRKKFNIYNEIVNGIVYIGDKEITADLEWNNFSSDEFYKIVKNNVGLVKTSFATYKEFVRVVEPILKDNKDVILFTISSGISGSYNGYSNYAEILLEDYPDRKIKVIDSLKYSSASGLLAIKCSEYKNEGMSFDDNVKKINEVKFSLHEMGIMDDLRFLAKNGRIAASKAFFGSLVGVQPVADFTRDGKNQPLGTIAGNKKADAFCIKYLLKTVKNIENQTIIIAESQRRQRAEIFKEQLLKVANPKEVIIVEIGMSCGPNIGPGMCTYFYFGDEISNNHEKENELFLKIKEEL